MTLINAYQVLSSDNHGLHAHGIFRTWAEASAKLDTMIPKSSVETSWLEAVVVSEAELEPKVEIDPDTLASFYACHPAD